METLRMVAWGFVDPDAVKKQSYRAFCRLRKQINAELKPHGLAMRIEPHPYYWGELIARQTGNHRATILMVRDVRNGLPSIACEDYKAACDYALSLIDPEYVQRGVHIPGGLYY